MPRTNPRSSSYSPSYRTNKPSTPHSAQQTRLNQPSRFSQSSLPPLPPSISLTPTRETPPPVTPAPRYRSNRSKSRSFDSLTPPGSLRDPKLRLTPPSRRLSRPHAQSKRFRTVSLEIRSRSLKPPILQPGSPPASISPPRNTTPHPIKKLKIAPSPPRHSLRTSTSPPSFRLDHVEFPPLQPDDDPSQHSQSNDAQPVGAGRSAQADLWPGGRLLTQRFRLEEEHFPPLRPASPELEAQRARSRQEESDMQEEYGEEKSLQDRLQRVHDVQEEEGSAGESNSEEGAEGQRGPGITTDVENFYDEDDSDEAESSYDDIDDKCDDSGNSCADYGEGDDCDSSSCEDQEGDVTNMDGQNSGFRGRCNPGGSRDSAGCSAERAVLPIRELFMPCDEPCKRANDLLHGGGQQQGGLLLGPSSSPFLADEDDSTLPHHLRSFRKLMTTITEEQGVDLSMEDLMLFDKLEGISLFKYGDCRSQMQSAGICVEVPKGVPLPEVTNDTWMFEYGPEERAVMVRANLLSPLGFSVLSWILMPGPYTVAPFIGVMRAVYFKNCLVDQVVRSLSLWSSLKRTLWHFALRIVTECVSDARTLAHLNRWLLGRKLGRESLVEAQESKFIVVPRSWLYWLNIKHKFVQEHGCYGDMAVRVGKPSQDSRASGFLSVISRASISARSLVDFFGGSDLSSKYGDIQGDIGCNYGNNWDEDYDDGGRPLKNGMEYLEVDRGNQLVYTKVVKRMELRNLSVGANVPVGGLNFGFNREYVPGYIELEKYRMGSIPVPFGSLSQYVGFQMKGSSQRSLLRRMKWLEEALNRKAIFPTGSNQIFLKLTTGYASTNRQVQIFEEEDCRVSRQDLNKTHRVEQKHSRDPGKIYFMDDGNGTEVFASRCYSRGSELWEIETPNLEPFQGGTTFVSRDLG